MSSRGPFRPKTCYDSMIQRPDAVSEGDCSGAVSPAWLRNWPLSGDTAKPPVSLWYRWIREAPGGSHPVAAAQRMPVSPGTGACFVGRCEACSLV